MKLLVFLESLAGAVFLFAALSKLFFRVSVAPFLIGLGVPAAMAVVLAWILIPLEGLAGAALLSGVAGFPSASAAAVLAVGFLFSQLIAFKEGTGSGCRCFGPLDRHPAPALGIARSSVLVALLAVIASLHAIDARWGWSQFSFLDEIGMHVLGAITGIGLIAVSALLHEVWMFEQSRPRRLAVAQTQGQVS